MFDWYIHREKKCRIGPEAAWHVTIFFWCSLFRRCKAWKTKPGSLLEGGEDPFPLSRSMRGI